MNNTATLRERLRDMSGTFQSIDFADISSAHAIITKMVLKGEVLLVSNTRPKVYKVGKLKDHKPRAAPKALSVKRVRVTPKAQLFIECWSGIFPEYFAKPDFSGYRSTVRNNLQEA